MKKILIVLLSLTLVVCCVCVPAFASDASNGYCPSSGDSHNYSDGVCADCGYTCTHMYDGGKCSYCSMVDPDFVALFTVLFDYEAELWNFSLSLSDTVLSGSVTPSQFVALSFSDYGRRVSVNGIEFIPFDIFLEDYGDLFESEPLGLNFVLFFDDELPYFYVPALDCNLFVYEFLFAVEAIDYALPLSTVEDEEEFAAFVMSEEVFGSLVTEVRYSTDVLGSIGQVFNSAISWVGTVAQTIAGEPLLLIGVIIGFIGLGVGLFCRLSRLR